MGDWQDKAACKGMDPNIFHPEFEDPDYSLIVAKAKAVCKQCPVKEECYQWSKRPEINNRLGIWGGLLPNERLARRKREHRRNLQRRMQRQFGLSALEARRMGRLAGW